MTLLERAQPDDWKDVFVRVLKTFVSGALSGTTLANFTSVKASEAALFAGVTAVYSLAQNAILKWTKT